MNSSNQFDLTKGNIKSVMLRFALPYLLACFLQTFYGLADMFIIGIYNESASTSAVSIGSQVMHMATVMIAGLTMGITVSIGHSLGAKTPRNAAKALCNSIILFLIFALVVTPVLFLSTDFITGIMQTPTEAIPETIKYLTICFIGLPFIIAYNVISGIYRGIGDTRSPLIFVAIACVVNVVVDFIFIGTFQLGASGAAYGTVIGQGISVLISLIFLKKRGLGFKIEKSDFAFSGRDLWSVVRVGLPIMFQDGLIQIGFLIITMIANTRGLTDSAAVGIVEKIICFMFLVPSAFLSTISAVTAQNMGAGKKGRALDALRFGLLVTSAWGLLCCGLCQIIPQVFVGAFTNEADVIAAGAVYLRSYSSDCFFAAIHFCFSGYFCGSQKSWISFVHNILSVSLVRVPLSYYANLYYPDTLLPMGFAAPAGSFLSVIICVIFFLIFRPRNIDRVKEEADVI